MKKFSLCFGAILAYWGVVFIGPGLVLLWNNLNYYLTGTGYGTGSLMYKVLKFLSQPVSFFLAYYVLQAILKEKHNLLAMVNCGVALCVCFVFVIVSEDNLNRWSLVVSSAACATTMVIAAQAFFSNPEEVTQATISKAAVDKIKRGVTNVLIAVLLWVVARIIPDFICAFYQQNTVVSYIIVSYIIYIFALIIGWLSASAISKKRFSKCIRVNLYLFASLEGIGFLGIILNLFKELRFYTGRYNFDASGIAYTDYPAIYGSIIIAILFYIGLCIFLAKKSVDFKSSEV